MYVLSPTKSGFYSGGCQGVSKLYQRPESTLCTGFAHGSLSSYDCLGDNIAADAIYPKIVRLRLRVVFGF